MAMTAEELQGTRDAIADIVAVAERYEKRATDLESRQVTLELAKKVAADLVGQGVIAQALESRAVETLLNPAEAVTLIQKLAADRAAYAADLADAQEVRPGRTVANAKVASAGEQTADQILDAGVQRISYMLQARQANR